MRRSSWLILFGAAGFVAFVFYSLMTVEPVHVISSHLNYLDGRVYVQGAVMNQGRVNRAINLEVHYYDGNGRSLGEDTLKLTKLRPGERRDFRSPGQSISGVKDFTILLTQGRNPYGN
ncbi:MAG TPA: FxLYD domain-containing protein [Candidatus Binataceae bacterium]|nr:FxLYD domain-containing protein [Candidatus Binataceae bacterium]